MKKIGLILLGIVVQFSIFARPCSLGMLEGQYKVKSAKCSGTGCDSEFISSILTTEYKVNYENGKVWFCMNHPGVSGCLQMQLAELEWWNGNTQTICLEEDVSGQLHRQIGRKDYYRHDKDCTSKSSTMVHQMGNHFYAIDINRSSHCPPKDFYREVFIELEKI